MIVTAAVRPRAQEAQVHKLSNAGAARRRDDRRGPRDVNARVRLLADLAVDAGAVGDGGAARERVGQAVLIVGRDRDETRSGFASNALVASVDPA